MSQKDSSKAYIKECIYERMLEDEAYASNARRDAREAALLEIVRLSEERGLYDE